MSTTERKLLNAKEVAGMLGISVSYAYKIIGLLNEELANSGYLTINGKVDELYLHRRYFTLEDSVNS